MPIARREIEGYIYFSWLWNGYLEFHGVSRAAGLPGLPGGFSFGQLSQTLAS